MKTYKAHSENHFLYNHCEVIVFNYLEVYVLSQLMVDNKKAYEVCIIGELHLKPFIIYENDILYFAQSGEVHRPLNNHTYSI